MSDYEQSYRFWKKAIGFVSLVIWIAMIALAFRLYPLISYLLGDILTYIVSMAIFFGPVAYAYNAMHKELDRRFPPQRYTEEINHQFNPKN